jgi:hypothetical protein
MEAYIKQTTSNDGINKIIFFLFKIPHVSFNF